MTEATSIVTGKIFAEIGTTENQIKGPYLWMPNLDMYVFREVTSG
jgi:hypothetical protein